jgi:hypothetical protein
MSYAPHTNDDVLSQLAAGIIPTPCPQIYGQFTESEFGHVFEYAERRWPDDTIAPELPHVVYVHEGQARLAKVLKTVAFVLVDENTIERWTIKKHHQYTMPRR